ncbi:unnamed protein product, partial [Didymodactylos carnosus]
SYTIQNNLVRPPNAQSTLLEDTLAITKNQPNLTLSSDLSPKDQNVFAVPLDKTRNVNEGNEQTTTRESANFNNPQLQDSNTSTLDSASMKNFRLYLSPSNSLLDVTTDENLNITFRDVCDNSPKKADDNQANDSLIHSAQKQLPSETRTDFSVTSTIEDDLVIPNSQPLNGKSDEQNEFQNGEQDNMETGNSQISFNINRIEQTDITRSVSNLPTSDTSNDIVSTKSPLVSPTRDISHCVSNNKILTPINKALYSLSQPVTSKFENIVAKHLEQQLLKNNHALVSTTPNVIKEQISPIYTTHEEEELHVKESISKTVRKYVLKTDKDGRTISRDLVSEV